MEQRQFHGAYFVPGPMNTLEVQILCYGDMPEPQPSALTSPNQLLLLYSTLMSPASQSFLQDVESTGVEMDTPSKLAKAHVLRERRFLLSNIANTLIVSVRTVCGYLLHPTLGPIPFPIQFGCPLILSVPLWGRVAFPFPLRWGMGIL